MRRAGPPRTVEFDPVTLDALTRPRTSASAIAEDDARLAHLADAAIRRKLPDLAVPLASPPLSSTDAALLVAAVRRGSQTARRLLSRVARAPVDAAPRVVASIEIGGGLGWVADARGGTLVDPRGAIPRTVAAAAPGRPAGALLIHPAIDPAVPMLPPRLTGMGVVSIDLPAASVRSPRGPLAAFRLAKLITVARRLEKPLSRIARITFGAAFAVMSVTLLLAIVRMPGGAATTDGLVTLAATAIGWGAAAFMAFEALTGHLLVDLLLGSRTSYERLALDRQAMMHLDDMERRGFNMTGGPT